LLANHRFYIKYYHHFPLQRLENRGVEGARCGGRREERKRKRKRKGRERRERGRKEGRVTANYWSLASLVVLLNY
jgi:hypothetical protein